jgi:Cu(I)/Ag(I) efflux system membrane fusion protein
MNRNTGRTGIVAGAVAAGVMIGVIVGFLLARGMMGDMAGMKGQEMKGMEMNIKGSPVKSMQGMEGMQGMSPAPSGAVAIPAVARQLIGVRSAPVAYAELEQEIRTVGTVNYDERKLTLINLKVSGWVREVFVDSVGRPVRKGEPLFSLYSPDLLATQDEYLLALKTQAQLADTPLADAKEGAAALVAGARDRLRFWDLTDEQIAALERRGKAEPILTVYAPSTGIVLRREALPGKYVEPGTTLYEVADISTVWIYTDIYEFEVAAVKLNQPAVVTFAAYPGETFHGTVSYIYPSVNAETRTVRVRLELPNPQLKLKPGMYGNATLRTDAIKTLVIPKEAVLDTGLRQLVFLDQGQGRYQPAQVRLGRRSQDWVEVLEGVKEGDRIVTSANFLLDAESKLTSASSMQGMMGRIGMADWQMRGAHEGKMEGMEGMKDMGSMKEIVVTEARQTGGLSLSLKTVPEKPKAGDVLLRLKVTDQAGKPLTDAQVAFLYTMPGMTDSKATARHTKDGFYEGKVMFGMGGTWVVTVNVTRPGRPPIAETFQLTVIGGGM